MKFLKRISLTRKASRGYSEQRKKYYDQLIETQTSPSFFIQLLSNYVHDNQSFRTERKFRAKGHLEFGTSKAHIIKQWGRPSYSTSRKHIFRHDILLYRTILGGHKAKYELHLINGTLFNFSLSFSYVQPEPLNDLCDTIVHKYLRNKTWLPKDSLKIFDRDDNMLFIEMRSGLVLNYLSSNPELHELVELAIDTDLAIQTQHKRRREMELAYCL